MSALEVKRYYTEKEFCELLGISRKTAFTMRENGEIAYVLIRGNQIRYRHTDVEEYERRNLVKPVRAKNAA